MVDLITKDDLLNKLRLYTKTPDNDTIRYKKKIEQLLIGCPELLYAINEHDLESELFDDDGNINWDSETGEPLGEWDRYFGSNANIRPFLFIPETQPKVKNFICYKIGFNEVPRYNKVERYMQVVFYIYVHGDNRIDKLTGIPRHDLIAAILQEKINWTNLFGTQCQIVSDQENMTDTNYIYRTFTLQNTMPNSITQTTNGATTIINKMGR